MKDPIIIPDRIHLIEFRNSIAQRRIQAIANAEYWKVVFNKSKKGTQDRVDASNKIVTNKVSARKDKIFLECIDKLIEE